MVEICTHSHVRWMYFGGDMHLLYFGRDMYLLACQVGVFWWSYLPACMSGECILVEICTYSHVRWMYFGRHMYLFTCQVDVLCWSYVPTSMSGEIMLAIQVSIAGFTDTDGFQVLVNFLCLPILHNSSWSQIYSSKNKNNLFFAGKG